jgi:hypothetical protein
MAEEDHAAAIARLTSEGKLDAALELLAEADESSLPLAPDVLSRLGESLDAAGRGSESRAVFQRLAPPEKAALPTRRRLERTTLRWQREAPEDDDPTDRVVDPCPAGDDTELVDVRAPEIAAREETDLSDTDEVVLPPPAPAPLDDSPEGPPEPPYGEDVPLTGVFPLAPSLDTVGPLARSSNDAALVYQAIAGYDPKDPWSAPQSVIGSAVMTSLQDTTIGVPHPWVDLPQTEAVAVAFIETRSALAA